jgi:hypothetical protein
METLVSVSCDRREKKVLKRECFGAAVCRLLMAASRRVLDGRRERSPRRRGELVLQCRTKGGT